MKTFGQFVWLMMVVAALLTSTYAFCGGCAGKHAKGAGETEKKAELIFSSPVVTAGTEVASQPVNHEVSVAYKTDRHGVFPSLKIRTLHG